MRLLRVLLWLGLLPGITTGVFGAEYTNPRALAINDTYVLTVDGYTGDEATTQPKTDANDGLNGDSVYFRRTNVARAHDGGSGPYWYTSAYQEPGEPNPAGDQWVDYVPPLAVLGAGRYHITAQYRMTSSRASYPALYIVHHATGTTTIQRSQLIGTDYVSFDLGDFDLGSTGWVRVQDTGSQSITFNKMKFTYLGPSVDNIPPTVTLQPQPAQVCLDESAQFTIEATGSGTLSYRWQKDQADLSDGGHYSGVTTPTLTISHADSNDEAGYRCVVTNAYGQAISSEAALGVIDCSAPLVVSPDHHWLQFRGRKVLLVGDSVTQGWMECGTNFNQTGYVDALASRGINVLMIWSYIGITDQVGDTRIGYDAPEIWPWVKTGSTFDLTQLNDAYFDRLRALVQYANSKDIVVLITIHDGWTKTRFAGHPLNAALGGPLTANSQYVELADYNNEMPTAYNASWTRQQKNQYFLERFCDRIIQATSDQPNVIYEMFNEGEWYNQTNLDNFQRHFLRFFRARTSRITMVNKSSFQSEANCDMVSLHQPNWSSSTNATESFNTFGPKFNSSPAKPFFFSEPVPEYRGDPSLHVALTRLMWGTVLGGAGFVVQNDCSFGWDTRSAMAAQTANRDAVYDLEGHCARFFNESGIDFASMTPQGSLASTGVCLARTGWEYVVFTQSASFTVNLAGTSGGLACRFYNPRTGQFQPTFYRPAGGTQTFTAPDSSDWVLHIVNNNDDTQPPTVPTSVHAVGVSGSSIQVTWTASTDNVGVAGYRIFRDGVEVGTSATTSYTDSGLQGQTSYSYTVAAYDGVGNLSAQSSPPAVAQTLVPSPVLMEDDFSTNPFTAPARWDVFYSDWTTPSAGSMQYTSTGGQSGGYVWRDRTGHRMIVWNSPFTSAGWDSARLTFYTKNVSPGSIIAEVRRDGTWVQAGAAVGANSDWTLETRDLTGLITGVRFKLMLTTGDYIARRLDAVKVEGVDSTPPNPGTASSPARCSDVAIPVTFAGAGDSGGSGLKQTTLWFRNGESGEWQSSGLSSGADSGSFLFDSEHGLSGDGVYYFTLQAEDFHGNVSTAPALKGDGDCSTVYDTTPADTPVVTDDGAYITTTGQVHGSWVSSDAVSGVIGYQYAVSTTKDDSGIVPGGEWRSAGPYQQAIRSGLSLSPGQVCYLLVKAENGVGLWSEIGVSDGVTVVSGANAGIDVAAARSRPDLTAVGLRSLTVSGVFGDAFYAQQADRTAGLRVAPIDMPAGLDVGSVVDVGGVLRATDGEREVSNATCAVH